MDISLEMKFLFVIFSGHGFIFTTFILFSLQRRRWRSGERCFSEQWSFAEARRTPGMLLRSLEEQVFRDLSQSPFYKELVTTSKFQSFRSLLPRSVVRCFIFVLLPTQSIRCNQFCY